ncbi:MAG: acetyl-CoA carboxylase biotin carboxyl carrier protein [Terriglobia bacterium]
MPLKNPRKEESQSPWGLEEIRAILDLLAERGVSEFEMEKNGLRVRVKRGSGSEASQLATSTAALDKPRPEPKPRKEPPIAPSGAAPAAAAEKVEDLHVVKSPIVGTFYAAPKPGAQPYVKAGDAVRKGQVLCVIEAMKLMNEIEADADGEVAKTFVENGQPVEYGQSLFGLVISKPE